MIEATLASIGRHASELPAGYLVYAIFDNEGRCCYVGATSKILARMSKHRSDLSSIRTITGEPGSLVVRVYTREDIDRVAKENGFVKNPKTAMYNDKQAAEACEWFMCDLLKPYLNVRKGWPTRIIYARDFLNRINIEIDSHVASGILEEWAVPFDHDRIIEAFLNGADSSELARAAGIQLQIG